MRFHKSVSYFAAGLFAAFLVNGRAAEVTWSKPADISGDTDVCRLWSLDRACAMGSAINLIVVNGVPFMPFSPPLQQPDSISDGKSIVALAGNENRVRLEPQSYGRGITHLSSDYQALLKSGVFSKNSAMALSLDGLTVGKTYLLQLWVNDSKGSSDEETFSDGFTASDKVHFNSAVENGAAGQYILGVFVADNDRQTITVMPQQGGPLINAFQLRVAESEPKPAIVSQPPPFSGYTGETATLAVLTVGNSPLFQWQKLSGDGKPKNLFDDNKFSGASTRQLAIRNLTADDAGNYRVLARYPAGSITSSVATVSVLLPPENQLINVDINFGGTTTYRGEGVLVGTPRHNYWNGIPGEIAFRDIALRDSAGAQTPVTLTLFREGKDGAVNPNSRNDLLKDYSATFHQTVSLNHLEPGGLYHLVVYSIGRMAHEAGVFSGAVEGVVRGGNFEDHDLANDFLEGINYIQNPFAVADNNGALTFEISPNEQSSGDFNGLQIQKLNTNHLAPFVLHQPASLQTYRGSQAALTVAAAGVRSAELNYQWQKIDPGSIANLSNENGVSGATEPTLVISSLTSASAGSYRVIVGCAFGSATSEVARVSIAPAPDLISVDFNSGPNGATYKGTGVVGSYAKNYWNGVNGRSQFEDIPLADTEGNPTPVTLSLLKREVDAYSSPLIANDLLKDYSVGSMQTVVIKHLEPSARYRLVVYSFGEMAKEGGVFSGAVTGISRGREGSSAGPAFTSFLSGTNYVENDSALSDAQGTLTFTVMPTKTEIPDGFFNSDLNGLQILKVK